MKGTIQYLDALSNHLGVNSDYALAQALGITRFTVSKYRRGVSGFSDDVALRVADLLNRPRGEVIIAIQAERARHSHNLPVADALADYLSKLGGMAA